MDKRQIRAFRSTLRRFERALDVQLKGCCSNVSVAQCHVLMEIESLENPTVGRLAGELGLDKSTLSRTIENLVATGHVVRKPDPSDRRVLRLRLTRAGEALCSELNRGSDAYCRQVFKRLPRRLHQGLLEHFRLLADAFVQQTEVVRKAGSCR